MQITLIWILNGRGGGGCELCVIKQVSERQIERESWHWFPCQLLLLNTKHSLNNSLGSHGAINEAVITGIGTSAVPFSKTTCYLSFSITLQETFPTGAHLRACLHPALNTKQTNILFTAQSDCHCHRFSHPSSSSAGSYGLIAPHLLEVCSRS